MIEPVTDLFAPAQLYAQEERDQAFTARLKELIKQHTGRDDNFLMIYWQPNGRGLRYSCHCNPLEVMALNHWIKTDLLPELHAENAAGRAWPCAAAARPAARRFASSAYSPSSSRLVAVAGKGRKW